MYMPRWKVLALLLDFALFGIAAVAVLGYALGMPHLYQPASGVGMALTTAIGFLLCSLIFGLVLFNMNGMPFGKATN